MIRFSKYLVLYAVISACVLIPGIFSLVTNGLRPAVDFTGGTLLEMRLENQIDTETIESRAMEAGIDIVYVQQSSEDVVLIRTKPAEDGAITTFIDSIRTTDETSVELLRNETVGPTLGSELLRKTIIAALLAVAGILIYVAYSFKSVIYGISAIIALLHDVLVVAGLFSIFGVIFQAEVDALFVTAVLTTMSFSVHDTIVVFDRIRELSKKQSRIAFEERVDTALTETMNRSLVNSLTIAFMLLALVLMGGDTIRWFAVALLIGTISGTYSSPFVATPSLLLLHRFVKSQAKKR